jgi:hypothetical protein
VVESVFSAVRTESLCKADCFLVFKGLGRPERDIIASVNRSLCEVPVILVRV